MKINNNNNNIEYFTTKVHSLIFFAEQYIIKQKTFKLMDYYCHCSPHSFRKSTIEAHFQWSQTWKNTTTCRPCLCKFYSNLKYSWNKQQEQQYIVIYNKGTLFNISRCTIIFNSYVKQNNQNSNWWIITATALHILPEKQQLKLTSNGAKPWKTCKPANPVCVHFFKSEIKLKISNWQIVLNKYRINK